MSRSLALLDAKEMVEIRHGYIQRRQKLRKQMEYYKGMAEMARNEVKDLAADYPEYAKEIGADGYSRDAADAVKVAKHLLGMEGA